VTNPEFVKWLAGFFELSGSPSLSRRQFHIINNHLNLVEAVEGCLDPFNRDIRAIAKYQIEVLSESEQLADAGVVADLKTKIIAQAAKT
jgi:hypothetical protein